MLGAILYISIAAATQTITMGEDGQWYVVAKPSDIKSSARINTLDQDQMIEPIKGLRVKDESIRYGPVVMIVHFENGSSKLSGDEVDRIRGLAKVYDGLVIEGHSDPGGSYTINQKLALERARSVAKILVAEGIRNIKVVSEGENKPLCRERTEECQMKNRRVVIRSEYKK